MAMKLTYKELEQRVKHLEKQARVLKREREERLQRERLQGVLEMAGAVCHELNQPMQVLSAYCERSLRNAMEGNPLNGHLQSIVEKIDNMSVIVRKLERIASYETKDYIEGKRIIDIDKACRAA
jgi:C4-dicarboxylate-specific signal transduction histidine kinase